MPKIKFIALSLNLASGGGSHLTLDLMIRYLKEQGYQVELITIRENNFSSVPYSVKAEKIYGRFLSVQKKIVNLLLQEEIDCDLFITYGPALIWGGGLYRKNGGQTPVIAFINNYLPMMGQSDLDLSLGHLAKIKKWLFNLKFKIWYWLIGKSWLKFTDLFLFDSPILLKQYKNFGFEEKKLDVLPEFIEIAQSKKKNINPLAKGIIKLLYVGRIIHDKGLDLLIEAISLLNNQALHLDIVGSGPDQKNLETLTKTKKLETVISFHPWLNQKELQNFYIKSDLFVHPCRWVEPFGRTIIEAMSYGLPIITTEGTGAAWVMSSAGLTFKKNDTKDLAQKIQLMVSDYQQLQHYSNLAQKRALDFNYRTIGLQFEKKIKAIFAAQKKRLV